MDNIKKLWRIYLFIVIATASAAVIFIYIEWSGIVKATTAELKLQNNVIANAIQAEFDKHQNIMQLLQDPMNLAELEPKKVIEGQSRFNQQVRKIIHNNPEIMSIGVASADGNCTFVLEHENVLLNIKTHQDTFAALQQSLKTQKLVIGHTQFLAELNEWIVPMLYPVKPSESQSTFGNYAVIMVLNLTHNTNIFSRLNYVFPYHFSIMRDDFYWQFVSHISQNAKTYAKWFNQSLRQDLIVAAENDIKQQTGESFRTLKQNLRQVVFFNKNRLGKKRLIALRYLSKYSYFVNTSIPNQVLIARLLPIVASVAVLFIAFALILLLIFKRHLKTLKKSRSALIYQSTHDFLTQLPNRQYLIDNFRQWHTKRHHKQFHLLYLDLNNFKSSNDLFGHTIGDKILIEVANVVKRCFENEFCIRHGGDEFVVCLAPKKSDELLALCHVFLTQLSQPIVIDNLSFSISASIGIANYPQDGDDLDTLLRKADMAMYEAKKHNKLVYHYSAWLEKRTKIVAQIENQLKTALTNQEFHLVYQPQIAAVSQKIVGVEALMRWHNPVLGAITPDKFIPVAESNGLINEIGWWVLTTALTEINQLMQQVSEAGKLEKLRLSINVSVYQLLSKQFIIDIQQLLEQQPFQFIELMIEITESVLIDDFKKAQQHIELIRSHNIQISLDDFGTGYSSLSVLHELPIDEIKIDQSFVRDLLTDEHDKQLVDGIISLGKNLHIATIAEGVETIEQANELANMGCQLFQGYYFAKPLTKAQLLEYIKNLAQ